jgi:putative transposase
MEERGGEGDHSTMQRWGVKYRPSLEEAFQRRKRPGWVSGRMDETYLKIKGQWYYLDRAVDQHGQTMDVLLSEPRDPAAGRRFLKKASRRHGVPETIPIDGRDATEAASKPSNEEPGPHSAIRQVNYLTKIVAQAHRGVKRIARPRLGVTAFEAAQATLVGLERRPMLKKQPLLVGAGDEGRPAAEQFYALAASSPHHQGHLSLHDLLSKICDTARKGSLCPCIFSGLAATPTLRKGSQRY